MTEHNADTVERHQNRDRNLMLNRATSDLERIICQHDPEIDVPIKDGVWDRLDKLALQIEASAMPQQEVTVKALVWDETYKDSAKAGPFERVNYVITKWHTGEFELSLSYPGYQTGCGDIPHQPTMEAAKAHAQAHYEATILSALSGQDAEGET